MAQKKAKKKKEFDMADDQKVNFDKPAVLFIRNLPPEYFKRFREEAKKRRLTSAGVLMQLLDENANYF